MLILETTGHLVVQQPDAGVEPPPHLPLLLLVTEDHSLWSRWPDGQWGRWPGVQVTRWPGGQMARWADELMSRSNRRHSFKTLESRGRFYQGSSELARVGGGRCP